MESRPRVWPDPSSGTPIQQRIPRKASHLLESGSSARLATRTFLSSTSTRWKSTFIRASKVKTLAWSDRGACLAANRCSPLSASRTVAESYGTKSARQASSVSRTELMERFCVIASVDLRRASASARADSNQSQLLGDLQFREFARRDVLSCAYQPSRNLQFIGDRKGLHPNPAEGTIPTPDPELFIELAIGNALFELGSHTPTILGNDEVRVGSRAIVQRRNRKAGDAFVGVVHVEDGFRFRVHHPKDFLDVASHLLKALLAVPE